MLGAVTRYEVGAYFRDQENHLFYVYDLVPDEDKVELEECLTRIDDEPVRKRHTKKWCDNNLRFVRGAPTLGELMDPRDVADPEEWGPIG